MAIVHRSLPIYTMRLPGARIYVVNATSLIPAVQKHVRTLSFTPILVDMSARLIGVSKKTFDIINRDPMSDNGFVLGMTKITQRTLNPGPSLDRLNRKAADIIARSLDSQATHESTTIELKGWVDHEIIMSTTDCIYGPLNPFRDPKVEAAWLKYETGLIPLLINLFPSATAAKHVRARRILVEAFESYIRDDGHSHEDTSAVIAERFEHYKQNGISVEDMARIEVGQALGLISNMKPAAFWMLYFVFSDPAVLRECRFELADVCAEQDGVNVVDTRRLSQSCPVLASTFQETLRVRGTGVSPRMAVEDELLDGRFLLKKGGIVLIPAWVHHHDEGNWGDEAARFNHRRFVRESPPKSRGYNPVAFRGFGGGSTLCPGRHFASAEVLALAALVILRFDMEPLSGRWLCPTTGKSKPGIAVHQPDQDLWVTLRRRDSAKWSLKV
ncbi:hypothetical protein CDD83_7861 [Cordyceps sp. RAO-2017]|nr:hypothetical protein CDD83_7861 [Cordyceps sp. RAO-2017]